MTTPKPRKTKTIYKKTLTKVLGHTITEGRTEVKVAARQLGIQRTSAQKALDILTRFDLIKERKYSDIGVSYFYPSHKRLFTFFVFCRGISFALVCDSALEIKYVIRCLYSTYMLPDENLHFFLKTACKSIRDRFVSLPGNTPYLAICGKYDSGSHRLDNESMPELSLLDISRFASERLKTKRCRIITYNSSDNPTDQNRDFLLGLLLKAIDNSITRKKNSTNKRATDDK